MGGGDHGQLVQPLHGFVTNAARKLGVTSRSQAIHRASALGYIGAGDPTGGGPRPMG